MFIYPSLFPKMFIFSIPIPQYDDDHYLIVELVHLKVVVGEPLVALVFYHCCCYLIIRWLLKADGYGKIWAMKTFSSYLEMVNIVQNWCINSVWSNQGVDCEHRYSQITLFEVMLNLGPATPGSQRKAGVSYKSSTYRFSITTGLPPVIIVFFF